jgi:UDP-N-acetylglucosamine 2-epimerase
VSGLIANPVTYAQMAHATNPYGNGAAAKQIVSLLAGSIGDY